MSFTYVDLFSGIGGFRIGLDALGGTSVGFSEIDKKAVETYKRNFNDPDSHDLGDVTRITHLPEVDLVVGGVPCQSWSVAGKRRGFDDPRGRLWYDAIRMVKTSKPKAFIFENVKGLVDPRNKDNLNLIIDSFEKIGYSVRYQLLNAYDFGAPQNRSRVFIVGFRKDLDDYASKFKYPLSKGKNSEIGDLIDGINKVDIKKSIFDPSEIYGGSIPRSRNAFQREDSLNDFFVFCDTRNGHSTIHSWDIYKTTNVEKNICMAILKNRRKRKYGSADGNPLSFEDITELVPEVKKSNLDSLVLKRILKITVDQKYTLVNSKNSSGIDGIYRIFLPNSPIFSTLTATGTRDFIATEYISCDNPKEYKNIFINNIYNPKKFRQVSSREAARIQGFPDSFICHESDYSAQKQFGNAVAPPVVEAVGRAIVNTGVFDTLVSNETAREARDYNAGEGLDAFQPNFQPS
jgi:DNA (cytosine-5)-methyltransferase 1